MSGSAPRHRLLVVDDSPDTRELLQRNLSAQGYEVLTAGTVAEALATLGAGHVDLVITDLKMPGASGLELVRHVKHALTGTAVIAITGYPSVEGAVAAVKLGVQEYLTKPFTQDELFAAVRSAVAGTAAREAASDRRPAGAGAFGMIGASEPMLAVMKAIGRAAAAATPVLLVGEHGTGRQMAAAAIHAAGARAAAPFLTLNCAGLPDWVLDGELPRGGFASAGRPAGGLIQLVDGGTLFVRNVSDLPPRAQDGLLAALDDRNFRLLASCHRELAPLVRGGWFREELFVRLAIDTIAVPPLRSRPGDAILLARHFATRFARDAGLPPAEFSPAAIALIDEYAWPGNVAELRQAIEAAALAGGGVIDVPDLPAHMRCGARPGGRVPTLRELEDGHIRRVLESVAGNKTRAAEILGINRKTLREKLREMAAPSGPAADD